MSSRQRIVLLLIAAVVLAGGVALAVATGGDEEETTARTTPTGIVEPTTGEDGRRTTPREPPERVEAIPIEDGGPAGEPRTLKYERGDTITLRFRADRAEEVHIHGFDRTIDVPLRGAVVTRFKASIEGIFEIEAHRTGEVLAKLEIRPK